MTIVDRKTTPTDIFEAVEHLAPTIADRAAEIEANRRLPSDLLDQLITAGAFRLTLPPSHGGAGADLPTTLRLFEKLARADASVAWTVMIGGSSWCDLVGLPRAAFDEVFDAEQDVIIAGAFNPAGTVVPLDGGYRVTGRWAFGSGCEHATWVFGMCMEGIVDGAPQLRIAVFAPDDIAIEDTWDVLGMRGTGSHHFSVTDLVVPADRTTNPFGDEPCVDVPLVHIPAPPLYSTCLSSVAVGVAQGAVDDILALAAGKVPLFEERALATNAGFQRDVASAEAALRAARAVLYETAESLWATATTGVPLTLEERARIRATAVWTTQQATAVVEAAFRMGGGTSIYASSPLQRRLRDIHTLSHHFLVKEDTLTTAGAILAGQDPAVMVF